MTRNAAGRVSLPSGGRLAVLTGFWLGALATLVLLACPPHPANRVLSRYGRTRGHLRVAPLERAILEQIDLSGEDLVAAILRRSRLTSVSLVGADLTAAHFDGAKLEDVDLSRARLVRATGRRACVSGGSLRGADCRFVDFTEARLESVSLMLVNMQHARLDRVQASGTDWAYADLTGAHLVRADLRRAWCPATVMCQADLRDADLRGVTLKGADLWGADLRGTRLEGAWYDEATRWPLGFDPRRHGARPLEPLPAPRVRS